MKHLFIFSVLVALVCSSCSTYEGYGLPAPTSQAGSEAKAKSRKSKPKPRDPNERPGLATSFGEVIKSPYQRSSFIRAAAKPAATDLIYYNSKEGIDAMAGYRWKSTTMREVRGGLLEWGVKSDGLGSVKSYYSSGDRFVAGKHGQSYKLVLKNVCKSRLEVVVSVDGLDVLDGKRASTKKRGYVIPAGETLEVRGWRTSPEHVAKFRFSSVGQSYANQRHGDARNVGVIGLAVFGEKGVDPWTFMPRELEQRRNASPFATPPGARQSERGWYTIEELGL